MHSLTLTHNKLHVDFSRRPPTLDEVRELTIAHGKMKVQGLLGMTAGIFLGTLGFTMALAAGEAPAPNRIIAAIISIISFILAFISINVFSKRFHRGSSVWENGNLLSKSIDHETILQFVAISERHPDIAIYLGNLKQQKRTPIWAEIYAAKELDVNQIIHGH